VIFRTENNFLRLQPACPAAAAAAAATAAAAAAAAATAVAAADIAQVLRPGLVKGSWTKEEDETVIRCIQAGITKVRG
jgi:hypothetical protein